MSNDENKIGQATPEQSMNIARLQIGVNEVLTGQPIGDVLSVLANSVAVGLMLSADDDRNEARKLIKQFLFMVIINMDEIVEAQDDPKKGVQ